MRGLIAFSPAAVLDFLPKNLSRPELVLFSRRFRAWWDGADFDEEAERTRAYAEAEKQAEATAQGAAPDTHGQVYRDKVEGVENRLRVSELIWGEGYLAPGTEENHIEYAQTMLMNEQVSMGVLGVGLGGPAREIAKETGVWVTGYERLKPVAEAGRIQCAKAGLKKKVDIHEYDPGRLDLPKNKFQGVISFGEFSFMEDKQGMLSRVTASLKSKGALLATDYVLAEDAKMEDVARGFCTYWGTPKLWPLKTYQDAIRTAGFDLRVSEDSTDQHLKLIADKWSDWRLVVDAINVLDIDEVDRSALLRIFGEEAEFWAAREKLLCDGRLKYYRFFALKK